MKGKIMGESVKELFKNIYNEIRKSFRPIPLTTNTIDDLRIGFLRAVNVYRPGGSLYKVHDGDGWCFVSPKNFNGETVNWRISINAIPSENFVTVMNNIASTFRGIYCFKFPNTKDGWNRLNPVTIYLDANNKDGVGCIEANLKREFGASDVNARMIGDLNKSYVLAVNSEPTSEQIKATRVLIRNAYDTALRECDGTVVGSSSHKEYFIKSQLLHSLANIYESKTAGHIISSPGIEEATAIALYFIENYQGLRIETPRRGESYCALVVRKYREATGVQPSIPIPSGIFLNTVRAASRDFNSTFPLLHAFLETGVALCGRSALPSLYSRH